MPPKPRPINYETNERGCHICVSHSRSAKGGYPQMARRVNGRLVVTRIHRLVYEQTYGPIPEGMQIRHTCDDPRCINPAHLLVGTAADNARDKVERGRQPWGEAMPTAKLTTDQVTEIRTSTEPGAVLAERFGVRRDTIYAVRRGQAWTNHPSELSPKHNSHALGKSGVRGVWWQPRDQVYAVVVCRVYLGTFKSLEEATRVAEEARERLARGESI